MVSSRRLATRIGGSVARAPRLSLIRFSTPVRAARGNTSQTSLGFLFLRATAREDGSWSAPSPTFLRDAALRMCG